MSRATRRIELDTPIVPIAVADSVIMEVEACFPLKLSGRQRAALEERLAERANAVYNANDKFRRSMRAKGNAGRDRLYMWMRHWLTAEVKQLRPRVHDKLQRTQFWNGVPLDLSRCRRPRRVS